jgi:hypothetical protein
MGNDGGSIPTRSELVKIKKKAPKVDSTEQDRAKWLTCALSKENLKENVCADYLGNIFDKYALLKAITEKSLPAWLSHIRGLKVFSFSLLLTLIHVKDFFEIHFTANVDYDPKKEKEVGEEGFHSPFECAITHAPVNGSHK